MMCLCACNGTFFAVVWFSVFLNKEMIDYLVRCMELKRPHHCLIMFIIRV